MIAAAHKKKPFLRFKDDNGVEKIYFHDDAFEIISDNIKQSKSWSEVGSYSWNKTPLHYESIILKL